MLHESFSVSGILISSFLLYYLIVLNLLFQFDCLNTLNDQLLENVRVQIEPSEGYTIVRDIPCAKLPYNETGTAYVVLQFPDELANSVGNFGATLKFVVIDCDPNTGLPDSDEGKKLLKGLCFMTTSTISMTMKNFLILRL